MAGYVFAIGGDENPVDIIRECAEKGIYSTYLSDLVSICLIFTPPHPVILKSITTNIKIVKIFFFIFFTPFKKYFINYNIIIT